MAPSTGVTGCCPGGCSGATQPSGAVLLHGPKYPQDSGTGVTSSWLRVPRQEAGPNPTPGVVFLALSPPHLQTPSSCPGNTRTSAKPRPLGCRMGPGAGRGARGRLHRGAVGDEVQGGEALASHRARSQPSRRLVRPCPTRCPRAAPGWLHAPRGAGIWDFHQRRGRKPRLQPTELLLTHKFYFDFYFFFMCLLFLQLKNRWV